MYLIATTLLLLLSWALLYFWRTSRLPPGPWGLPIVGYLPWLAGRHPHLKFSALSEEYGPIYSLRMGSIFTVVLSCPKLIRQAFALDDFSGRAPLYLTHGIMKGNGIICVEGEKWKETRRFVSSALRSLGMVKFGQGRLKMQADILKGVGGVLDNLKGRNLSQPINPEPILIHELGNILFRLVFGKEWTEDDETWRTLQHLQEEGTKYIGVSAAINFLPFLRFLPKYKASRKFIDDGIAFSHRIYQQLLNSYEVDNSGTEQPEHVMGAYSEEMRRRGEHGHFNRTQYNYLMADIFGAGVDTTLATIRWFLLFMALHPEWQARVQEELDNISGFGDVLLDHLTEGTILEACVWETQRLRPVTPVGIPHGTTKDTVLAGYRIPAGTMVIPLQWAVHMSPEAYDQPTVFRPSRFFAEDGRLNKPENFLPFQAGKRMCVGEEYARALLLLFGGNILKRYRIALPEGLVLDLNGEPGITLTPPMYELLLTPRL